MAGVRCVISGYYDASGGRIHYSGVPGFHFADNQGQFSLPLPRSDPFVDLQFDDGKHGPVFLDKIKPADSPLRVVMPEGKVLRGRIVEHVRDAVVPIPHCMVELRMPQEGACYERKQVTDDKGEFQFRVSEARGKRSWMLYLGGKWLPVDYAQVTPETVMVLEVSVKMTPIAEPSAPANVAAPRR